MVAQLCQEGVPVPRPEVPWANVAFLFGAFPLGPRATCHSKAFEERKEIASFLVNCDFARRSFQCFGYHEKKREQVGPEFTICFFPLHPPPLFPSRPSGRGEWLRGGMGLDVKDRPPVWLPGFCFKNTMKKGEFEHPKDAKNSALLAGSPLGRWQIPGFPLENWKIEQLWPLPSDMVASGQLRRSIFPEDGPSPALHRAQHPRGREPKPGPHGTVSVAFVTLDQGLLWPAS